MPRPSNAAWGALGDWRQRSLVRGNVLVVLSLAVAFRLSNFPHNQESGWLVLPLLGGMAGTVDTLRCMRTKWSWYHGGVVLCAYMDLMAVCLIAFFLVYPLWL